MLIDTHCHLHFDAYDADREAVIGRALEHGVERLVNVGTDPVTNEQARQLAATHRFMAYTAGLHPHHAHEVGEEAVDAIDRAVQAHRPAAIGEIGLDYFKSQGEAELQKRTFVAMIRLALRHDLPVIVHSRHAFKDTMEILRAEGQGRLKGVMHCFSYGTEELKELLEIGFLASFTCNLTFKNAGALLDVAVSAPLDRIMLETDSPYLAPQVYRGKRNEPACLTHLAEFLAERRKIPTEELAAVTSRTAETFFRLNKAL